MSKKKAQDLFYGNNYQKFNSLKLQLQRQNLSLLKQRQKIEGKTVGYTTLPSQTTIIDKNDLSFEEGQWEQNFQLPLLQKIGKTTPISGKNKLRQSINQYGQFLSDDIIEMIDQIQNKALLQIQSLRRDKILLLKRLNKQMKSHNVQKIHRIGYQKKNEFLTQQLSKSNVKSKEQNYKNIANTIYEEQNQNSPSPQNTDQKSRRIQQNQQYNNHNMNIFPNQQHYQSIRQNQPVLKHNKIQQQKIPSYFPRAQRTNPINNVNPQNYYHPGQNPQIPNTYQQKNMETQFNRLKNQNLSLRNTLSRQNSQNTLPVNKNSLINQLKGLQSRANYYQRLILKAKGNQNTSQRFEGSQMETLLLQGTRLAQDGERLIKVKSNPQFKGLITAYNSDQPYRNAKKNFTHIQLNTQIEKKQQTPKNYSKFNKNYQSNNHFSQGSYENIIQNMQKAVYS